MSLKKKRHYKSAANDLNLKSDIAIIGMACRFPGARNYNQFWYNIANGVNSIQEIPAERWNIEEYYSSDTNAPNKSNSKWGGFIDDIDKFDAQFFNITAIEAESMDPQQRIMLELTWKCLEDAGYTPQQCLKQNVGLFLGACNYDYKELQDRSIKDTASHFLTGTANTIIANRISYFFDFNGPSITIDTACSSSLVAIHQASQALRNHECQLALAGGVNVMCIGERYIPFSKLGMLSPTGQCKAFDDSADGYVRGEGAGIILLKPLEQAIKDKDHIHAIIKASRINHGGHARTITSPNTFAEAQLLIDVYKEAKIYPDTMGYIETHGTGTPLGDPIEIHGLKRAFTSLFKQSGQEIPEQPYCCIGTVKTNIGHLESAAGIAGVIKVILTIQNKKLPALQNFKVLNSRISLKGSPFFIADTIREWKISQAKTPRRAGVSSFGFGGTNAHVIIEEAPERESDDFVAQQAKPYYLITLSAKTKDALQQKIIDLAAWLNSNSIGDNQQGNGNIAASIVADNKAISLANISYTLNVGRSHFDKRCSIVVSSMEELTEKLEQLQKPNNKVSGCFQGEVEKTPDDTAIYRKVLEMTIKELEIANENIQQNNSQDSEPYKSTLEALANLYVKGYDLDWQLLHQGESRRRISLPTYPFAKERYWIPMNANSADINNKQIYATAVDKQNTLDHNTYYYNIVWKQKSLITPAAAEISSVAAKPTLILMDANQILWDIPKSLSLIIYVRYGIDYRKIDNYNYTLRVDQKDDYILLFNDLQKDSLLPAQIIHLLTPSNKLTSQSLNADLDNFAKSLDSSVYPFINLFQVLQDKLESTLKYLIVFVEDHGYSQSQYEALSGLLHGVRILQPNIALEVLQLERDALNSKYKFKTLLQELCNNTDEVVRYRNKQRYVRQVEEYIPQINNLAHTNIRKNGLYLITGGLGGIGYQLAKHLSQEYQAKLILTGRKALDQDTKLLLNKLRQNNTAIYVRGDISNNNDVSELATMIRNKFDKLYGIFHCAGVAGTTSIMHINKISFLNDIAAKVYGTYLLDQLIPQENLDFFVTFSSIASEVGDFGVGSYAFANRFMDNYMEWRDTQRIQGLKIGKSLSINWPYWELENGGMSLPEEAASVYLEYSGLQMLGIKQGIQHLLNILSFPQSQILLAQGSKLKINKILKTPDQTRQSPDIPINQPLLDTTKTEIIDVKEQIKQYLTKVFMQLTSLQEQQINSYVKFEEYGVDSIMLANFNQKLKKDLGNLPDMLLFKYRTLESLSDYLFKEKFMNSAGAANFILPNHFTVTE